MDLPKEKKKWFSPAPYWLTDGEIDWALGEIKNQLELEGQGKRFKFLEATRFMYVLNVPNTTEADAHLAFPALINEFTSFKNGELVFIPVNNPGFHWSLLVYEVKNKNFYHFDTLKKGNKEYVGPLVKELLKHIHEDENINLTTHLFFRNSAIQENTSVCGVAVIAITERIVREGLDANLVDLDHNFEPEREMWRQRLKSVYLESDEEEDDGESEKSEKGESDNESIPPSPNEALITQILTVLDVWKANTTEEEKESVKKVIEQLTDNEGPEKKQYQAVKQLINNYSYYNSWRLEDYLKRWAKLLGISKKEKKDEEEQIIPDWLFPEEEQEDGPKPPTKPPIKHKEPRKPWECKICEKRVFFSKAEFIQAHGVPKLEPSIWIYKTYQPNKKEPYFISVWVCKVCKQKEHIPKCKYYKEIKLIIPKPKIFDWDAYWKWWFGVYTLDWYEERFFGKY